MSTYIVWFSRVRDFMHMWCGQDPMDLQHAGEKVKVDWIEKYKRGLTYREAIQEGIDAGLINEPAVVR